MKTLAILTTVLWITSCTHGARNDHYYCNDRTSQEEYERCMQAGEQIEQSQRVE